MYGVPYGSRNWPFTTRSGLKSKKGPLFLSPVGEYQPAAATAGGCAYPNGFVAELLKPYRFVWNTGRNGARVGSWSGNPSPNPPRKKTIAMFPSMTMFNGVFGGIGGCD